ncbi:predicted transcriptional regulator [Pelotomaculum thermopropionicum SI]|uniref:Predicted transcriptional regulator n=1 Tax=Pelotomaculum thermopropionicum (strain DSM 13744 / JCM 10971 / SI) TaxID=370438 RepID=A5D4K8_PELTS|nr:predicted transcriptional regulator [Pelotomaculum thermopropionicum SI]
MEEAIDLLEERAELLKALAHPSRLAILETLKEGERCVCEIIDRVVLEQSNTSQHLNVLKKSGILGSRKEGARVIYWVTNPEIYKLLDILDAVIMDKAEKSSRLLVQSRSTGGTGSV